MFYSFDVITVIVEIPIYAIKNARLVGSLYNFKLWLSKGSLEDKILVHKPPRNCVRCARCGTPVDGPYCQGCALLRKEFMEGLLTNFFKEHSETIIDYNDDSTSSDDDSYENIEYVDASSPDVEIVSLEVVEIVDPEVGRINDDDILREKLSNVIFLLPKIDA
ncbi:hypothetical protein Tco_0006451 [Tanacetum coccineum]